MTEGYGLKTAALKKLKAENVRLVVSVDCGITAVEEAQSAHEIGLDLIITDHHTPLEELPKALAVVNPKRDDSAYPFKELSGAGVAYKVLEALYRNLGKIDSVAKYLELAAIGTVADIMPLLGENRYIVKTGLILLTPLPRRG